MQKLRRTVCAAAAGIVLLAGSPTSYGAAFQVTFDPIYVDLYGVAKFELTAPCLAHDNNYDTLAELAGLALNGCVVSLESANISTGGINGDFQLYEPELPFVILSSLLVVNHELAGLSTPVFFPIRLEPFGESENLSSLAGIFHDECDATLAFKAPSNANPAGSATFVGCGADGNPLRPLSGDVISIARVPEPGTLALLAVAGVAGWWTRRRRWAARGEAALAR
jgi:hypothetical protein